MGANKAPGPDGLNGLFFQQHWNIIGGDILKEVKLFFESGTLNPALNRTQIILIPKNQNPERLEQFRPISLCNFVYKIISKILANRLKPLLPDIIAEEQSAFVGNRQIQDNILIVQEVIHRLRTRDRRRKFQAILKLDMQKAYDRIEWDFLQQCLYKMGFRAEWVKWVMQCVSTVSYSIKFNGESLPYFKPSRGIRQGDPLSPYLFIIVANVLSHMMKQALAEDTIHGIKLNRHCPTLSHLLFADDSIFFLDGTVMESQNLATILHQYCYASGQAINLNKSGLFFSKGCPDRLRRNMLAVLRVPEIAKTGKYLGIPSDWGASKKDIFAWILARVNSKMESWKENLLSRAGKEILLKSVVQAIPQYAMSIFKIPISIIKAIEKKIANFWWRNNNKIAGMHWRKWDLLKLSKEEGGLGFKDLMVFNIAMLGKQAWRISQCQNSLWSQLMKGLYFPNCDFWRARKGSHPSWGWQSLLAGRDAIAPQVMWVVGNGQKISIREDKWVKIGPIGGRASPNEPSKVADLIDFDAVQWKEDLLKSLFDDFLVSEIKAIHFGLPNTEDKLVWTKDKSGTYTVKSGYFEIRKFFMHRETKATTSHQIDPAIWKLIWNSGIQPKIKFFLWSASQNALPTLDNLYRRKIVPAPMCSICMLEPETIEHTLLLCPWTAHIWKELNIILNWSPQFFGAFGKIVTTPSSRNNPLTHTTP